MASTAELSYVEAKAFDYADALERVGFVCLVFYDIHGSVLIQTTPPLGALMGMGLALSEMHGSEFANA